MTRSTADGKGIVIMRSERSMKMWRLLDDPKGLKMHVEDSSSSFDMTIPQEDEDALFRFLESRRKSLAEGTHKPVVHGRKEILFLLCRTCGGRGYSTCPECNGTGKIPA